MRTLLLTALLAAGCASNVPVHTYTYYCATTADCAKGYTCSANVCSLTTASGADAAGTSDIEQPADVDTGTGDANKPKDADVNPHCTSSDVACLTKCGTNKCPYLLLKCDQDKECKAALTCYAGCSTVPCRVQCLNGASTASKANLEALQTCLGTNCM